MKKLAAIVVLLLCIGCGEKPVEKPERLLDKKEMVNILYDLSILQAVNSYQQKILDDNKIDPKTYIYKKYKIDSLTFAQNDKYYASQLEEYEDIHKKVAERLKADKAAYDPAGKKPAVRLNKKRLKDKVVTPATK
jgi:hypothetical protein